MRIITILNFFSFLKIIIIIRVKSVFLIVYCFGFDEFLIIIC